MEPSFKKGFWAGFWSALFIVVMGLVAGRLPGIRGELARNSREMRIFPDPEAGAAGENGINKQHDNMLTVDVKGCASFVEGAKYDAFVIVDEAYYYFYEGSKTSVPLTQKYSNMAVLRTFSKMLAIPALRLGAVIGCEEVIHYVNNWRPHYTVNVVTLRFAEAIIDNHDKLISEMKATFDDGKNYVLSRLAERNYHVIPSNGCFLCIKLQHVHMDYAFEELKKRNILVFCGSGLLEDYVRLTVSSKKYMEKFVDALFEIDV